MTDVVFGLIILSNLVFLGSGSLTMYVRMVSLQGVALGLLAWTGENSAAGHAVVLSAASVVMKGVVFPLMVSYAIRRADVRREVEPYVGPLPSLVLGLAGLFACVWMGGTIPWPEPPVSVWAAPVAMMTMGVGLFLIVSRRKAITQVLGYLVLENGIYALGVSLLSREPLVVELGILLDLFVAVFVMGIVVFHISREFDHMDTDRMTLLKD